MLPNNQPLADNELDRLKQQLSAKRRRSQHLSDSYHRAIAERDTAQEQARRNIEKNLELLKQLDQARQQIAHLQAALESRPVIDDTEQTDGDSEQADDDSEQTITLQREYRTNSKTGKQYGPYWYGYWREGTKIKKRYYGKRLPPEMKKRLREDNRESDSGNIDQDV